MSESPLSPAPPPPGSPRAAPVGESPFWLMISAAMFLYVGFGLDPRGISGNALYDGSVTVFNWMAKGVGIGLLIVWAGALAGWRPAMLLSALLAGAAAAVCAGCGLIWVTHGDSQGWLLFIFAMVNFSAAGSVWRMWQGASA